MSKTNTFENELLALVFTNSSMGSVGDATGLRGSSSTGSLYISLHVGDPGEAGNQATSETTYTGYARVGVSRTTSGFTVLNNSVSPVNNVDFGECTAAPGSTISWFGVGTDSTGGGKLLYKGTLTPAISMSTGVIPRIKNTSTITED